MMGLDGDLEGMYVLVWTDSNVDGPNGVVVVLWHDQRGQRRFKRVANECGLSVRGLEECRWRSGEVAMFTHKGRKQLLLSGSRITGTSLEFGRRRNRRRRKSVEFMHHVNSSSKKITKNCN